MADPFAVELLPRAAYTTNGSGSTIDLGEKRRAVKLVLDVSALTGGSSVEIAIETSATGDANSWVNRKQFKINALGPTEIVLTRLQRFVRATRSNISGSLTFLLDGFAHALYATPDDLTKYAAPSCDLKSVSELALDLACFAASDQADACMARRYTLPLVAWPDELTRNVARIAVWDAISGTRSDINLDGPDGVPYLQTQNADKWLREIGSGTRSPPGLIDSTPVKRGAAPRVSSARAERGWHESSTDAED